jgi:radical SAM protein with 4Fe4S-binding SPASM domain
MANSAITQSPTFCSAPWTSFNIDQTGRVSPCMHAVDAIGNIKQNTIHEIINGAELTSIKQAMQQGQWHDTCKLCKQSEDTTGVSARTQRHCDAATIDAIDQDITWFEPQHFVVNWSNLCNLSCVYCNPETSTAWQSVKKIPIKYVRNDQQSILELMQAKGKSLQGLVLGGGEPLLQKGLLDMLRCLDSQKVRVMVTTNLSMDLANNDIYNELKTWPSVDWQVSFDNCTADRFEYVRDGANWIQFKTNLDLLKADGQHVQAHPAYSIYCAFDLVEYYEFCEANDLNLFWCELTNPWDLDVRRLSPEIRQLAVDEIDRVTQRWGQKNEHNLAVSTLQRYRAQLLDNSYIFNVNEYTPDTLAWHRNIELELNKSKKFEDLWPDLARRLK